MYGFLSFHWDVDELAEEDQRAVAALNAASPSLPSAGYATHDRDALLAAFQRLLRSTDIRARGVALDQYAYAEAQQRWGADNPLTKFDAEVRAQARAMLAMAPDSGGAIADQPLVIACWNSALGALYFLADGDSSDLPRIVEVLDAASADDLLDVRAFGALEVRLIDADDTTCQRVGAWLAAAIADERLPTEVRIGAVRVFLDRRYAARLGHHDAIVDALDHPQIRLSIQAADALLGLGRSHHDAVRRTIAGWPDDAPYPADEVRQRLADADELARARTRLATAADPVTVVAALRTLAEHGEPSDVPGLLAILEGDRAAYLHDGDAFGAAVDGCLLEADAHTVAYTASRLAAVFADDRVPVAVRALAIQPFWYDIEASERTDLIALLDHDDLRLSAAAALALVDEPGSEAPVRRAAARWPDDAPYPASKVRDLLS